MLLIPANISTSDQRCLNVVDQRWNNVDPTLKMKQNPTSDFPLYCLLHCDRKCHFISSEAYWQKQPPEVFYQKGVPTNFSIFTGKHLCQNLSFKRLYCRFFPVNFLKFVRPLFSQSTFGRLLLYLEPCQVTMIQVFCGNSNPTNTPSGFHVVSREVFVGAFVAKSLTVFAKKKQKKPSYMSKRALVTHC